MKTIIVHHHKATGDGGNAVTRCNSMLAQLRNSIPGDIRDDRESEASRIEGKLNFAKGIIDRLLVELRELG